jgi:polyisoprenoid-binding protein YceI
VWDFEMYYSVVPIKMNLSFALQHLNSSHFFNWKSYNHAAYTSTQIIILYRINESYIFKK